MRLKNIAYFRTCESSYELKNMSLFHSWQSFSLKDQTVNNLDAVGQEEKSRKSHMYLYYKGESKFPQMFIVELQSIIKIEYAFL